MIKIKKQKGGVKEKEIYAERNDEKENENLFNIIRQSWIFTTTNPNSVLWKSSQDGIFLIPDKINYKNYIHLYNIEEKIEEKNYNLKLFLFIKYNNKYINPISTNIYENEENTNKNFIIEYNINLCKNIFKIDNISTIICNELLANYELAKKIVESKK